jgi:CTP:molybdopterin cytidylyltransferase MocA
VGDDVAVAVLSAGRGSRLGGSDPKPLLEWRGRPLVAWALDAARESGLAPVLLVTGYRGREVRRAVEHEGHGSGVEIVYNPAWRSGIASSLRRALSVLDARDRVGAVCIGLADQPRIGPEAYRRLAAAPRGDAAIAVATYRGERGNPVLLARSIWPEAMALRGDVGARMLMGSHTVVEVGCDGTGDPADVDRLDDLDRLGGAPGRAE